MPKKKSELKTDVEELLERAILEEATEAVWQVFEGAMSKLDEPNFVLWKEHLNGASNSDLSKRSGLHEREVKRILDHTRKELIETVRREKSTRQ